MPEIDWSLPYPSQREPVFARNVVATSQPLAAQAGLHMLRQGGNAIDAAVATAIALTVLEPTSNGIGSDAFALVWAGGGLHGVNASGRAPAALDLGAFANDDSIPFRGWGGVTVPGAVSAWAALSQQFGALPFEKLFGPAIDYAQNGFPVAPQTSFYWRRGRQSYEGLESFQDTFCPNGFAPRPGDVARLPDHARTLRTIGESGGEAFYRGPLAKQIADHARATGGWIREQDLSAHAADWVRPISLDYHGWTLNEIPPNGQGIVALIALGILRNLDVASVDVDSPDSVHVQIEAMKLAFADGYRYVADPDHMDVTAEALLDKAYLASRAKRIDLKQARDFQAGEPRHGGTVLLCAADADGNMVSFIQSNYTGFGSGIVVPGTGIALQNRGCCFTLEDGHPNRAAPGKRPYHTIIPGFVTRNGDPLMAFGVMGGFMQPQGHAQVVVRLADYGQNPQAALDAPRWRVDGGMKVTLEPGFDAAVYRDLKARGHDLSIARARTVSHGGGQAILRLDGGMYAGASDPRRDGHAAGF